MRTVRFGLIGAGLMGREFASAVARWCHLPGIDVRPEIVAVCSKHTNTHDWYRRNFPGIKQFTTDFTELLANDQVEAVYAAVPHILHQEVYCATLDAGKHLMGEKPFGIDKPANDSIMARVRECPHLLTRCSSQMPFYPAAQRIGKLIESGVIGKIIEVETGFLHSSDLDPNKPINWKRRIETNGEYGVMGDLGMHACHIPFRAGWRPRNVRAILSDIINERPDGGGANVPCTTSDNATLLCEMESPVSGELFPWTLKSQRIAPGERNTWYVRILGTRTSLRFSTKNPKLLEMLEYSCGEQAWSQIEMGMESAFPGITGSNFEFGFSDAIQQMWAAYLYELHHGQPLNRFAGCVTPEEVAVSHRLFTAALKSHKTSTVAVV